VKKAESVQYMMLGAWTWRLRKEMVKKRVRVRSEVCCLQKDRFNSNSVKGGVKNVCDV
jgi:hypothetical protein